MPTVSVVLGTNHLVGLVYVHYTKEVNFCAERRLRAENSHHFEKSVHITRTVHYTCTLHDYKYLSKMVGGGNGCTTQSSMLECFTTVH